MQPAGSLLELGLELSIARGATSLFQWGQLFPPMKHSVYGLQLFIDGDALTKARRCRT